MKKRIPDYFFSGCGITALDLLKTSITSIGNRAFCNCKLENAWISEQVKSIGDKAFAGNSANFTIHGYDNYGDEVSGAKTCALANNYAYDSLGLHTWDSKTTTVGNIIVKHCLVCGKYSSNNVYDDAEAPGYAYGSVICEANGKNRIGKKTTYRSSIRIKKKYVQGGYFKLTGSGAVLSNVSSSNTNVINPVAQLDGSYYLNVKHAGSAKVSFSVGSHTRKITFSISKAAQTVKYKKLIIVEAGTKSFKLKAACATGTLSYDYNSKYLFVSVKGTVTLKSKKTGTYKIAITAKQSQDYAMSSGNYCKIKVVPPSIKLKTTSKNLKESDLSQSKQSFALKAASKIYKLSFTQKNNKKYFSISKTGKVTVKKGTPKGVYKLAVKVKAKKGSSSFAKTLNVPVTVE